MAEHHTSKGKQFIFWLLLVLVLIGFAEIISALLLYRFIPSRVRNRAEFRTAQDYAAAYRQSKARAAALRARQETAADNPGAASLQMFHPILGWDYPRNVTYADAHGVRYHHGPRGERRTCTAFPVDLIATYGDSFTYCSDEPDCSTWQTYLGELLQANVLNFGVAGYGTDQALLKYERNEAGISTPVVILGILPDDINRTVNIFRTFYAPDAMLALTKPLYIREGPGFRCLPNPIQRIEDLNQLENPRVLSKLGLQDYWFTKWFHAPRFGFPYSLTLVLWRKTLLEHLQQDLGLSAWGIVKTSYPGNLFEEPGPLAIMCHIVDRFVQVVEGRHARPVIVLMAHRELIQETMRFGQSRIQPLASYLEDKGYAYIDLIRDLADRKPSKDDLNRWFREHATPEGNRIIAQIIADQLRRDEMLEEISFTHHRLNK